MEETALCKRHLQSPVSVTCRLYASERRGDEPKRLQLTARGIELHSVVASSVSSVSDLIPWCWILGASECTRSIRHRFVPVDEADSDLENDREFVVFGCMPKSEKLSGRGGLLGCLTSLAMAVLPSALTGSTSENAGVDRVLVQWLFKCEANDMGGEVATTIVKAIQFFADPRAGEMTEKLLDGYEDLPLRKFLVVINPAGGTGDAQQTYEQQVAPVFEQANIVVETVVTRHAGHATKLMAEVPLNQFDCIVAVGGDGLLSEMLQGLMQRKNWQQAVLQPLGIIPGGSGNGLSASLLSRAGEQPTVLNAAYSLVKGHVEDLDLFSATNGNGADMYGFLSLEWAFVADMDINSERYRFFGDLRFFIATALQIFGFGRTNYPGRLRYRAVKNEEPLPETYHDAFSSTVATAKPICACLEEEQDSRNAEKWLEMQGSFYMFWGMNTSHAAADAHIAPTADISDGLFHLMLVSGARYSRFQLARLMMGIEDGSHLDLDRVQLIRTRAFTIRASNANDLICVDGELFPGPEIKVEVHRGLGRILCLPAKKDK